jgi:signal transduction histidine kinase
LIHKTTRLRWSIRNRIMVPYLALVVGLIGGTGVWSARWAADRASAEFMGRARALTETLRKSSFPLNQAVLSQLKGLGGVEFGLLNDQGMLVEGTFANSFDRKASTDFHFPNDAHFDDFTTFWTSGSQRYRIAFVKRLATGSPRVLVLLPEAAIQEAAWDARRGVIWLTILGGSLAVGMATWIGQSLSKPMSAVLATVRRIGQGDLDPKGLPIERSDEIGELSQGVAQMVERLRTLEAEQVQTERLRLIRQISAGFAHEQRNALTAARMTLQLFMERNVDRNVQPLRVALSELERMERQIKKFLEVARPSTPLLQAISVEPLVMACIAGLEASAHHRKIHLLATFDKPLPKVMVDPDGISQVFINLLLNALDAAGPGGKVIVAGRQVDDIVRLEISDSGPGVPESDAAHLFEAFYTTKPEGVGLGLAQSAAIVHDHGGTIHYLREGDFTCFVVSLPINIPS